MISEYAHILLNLCGVLALIFVSLFVLRKIKTGRYAINKYIELMQVVPTGPKEKILLIKVKNVMLLLGATSNHIDVLHTFDPIDFPPSAEPKKNSFSETMLSIYNKKKMNEKDISLT